MSPEYKDPITPPPELVREWRSEWIHNAPGDLDELGFLAQRSARWGADQELDACLEWISKQNWTSDQLRTARRPEPPSLKQQALEIVKGTPVNSAGLYSYEQVEIIRRALEQLDD